MKRQQFLTTDVLRLEVEDNPNGRLINLVQNWTGEFGGWGWVTPAPDSVLDPVDDVVGRFLYITGTGPNTLSTETMPVTPGKYLNTRWSLSRQRLTSALHYDARLDYIDGAGGVLSSVVLESLAMPADNAVTPTYPDAEVVPLGAVGARLRFDIFNGTTGTGNPADGRVLYLASVAVIETAAPLELALLVPDYPAAYYLDVLGSTHKLTVDRAELDVGTLVATIFDSELDPAKADSIIKTGRRVRLLARMPIMGFDEADFGEGDYGGDDSPWSPIFTGKIARGQTSYDYRRRDQSKQVRITLTAVDPLTPLTRITRAEGVGTIAELPYVLEGCGLPWNVNGSGRQVMTASIVARNESAKAVDQVAITRDSALGFAWVDRFGTLQAWDADQIGDGPVPVGGVTQIDEADYNDLEIDYDTDRCINEVTITYVRINPGTQETEEVTYGPYIDAESVRVHDVHSATFTVQGVDEATLPAYAQAILDANAWPVVRVLTATIPIVERRATPKVLMDLYHRIAVINERAGLNEPLRVVGVHHEIGTSSWSAQYDFAGEDRVASPQVTPSVPSSSGSKTMAQLLRPVGEVTMWWGSIFDVPVGWLACNGGTFSADTYPALAEHLAGTTLPNFVDRMPIGAGIKNIGTSGEVGASGDLGWRAVYFIIRAA